MSGNATACRLEKVEVIRHVGMMVFLHVRVQTPNTTAIRKASHLPSLLAYTFRFPQFFARLPWNPINNIIINPQ